MVGVIAVLRATSEVREGAERMRFTVLSLGVVVLTLALVVSAFHRLFLYEQAFGLTMLRLYAQSAIVWVGLVLVFLGVWIAGVGARRTWVWSAAGVTALLMLFAMNVLNPEAFVVRHNVNAPASIHIRPVVRHDRTRRRRGPGTARAPRAARVPVCRRGATAHQGWASLQRRGRPSREDREPRVRQRKEADVSFVPITEALERIARGEIVIVVDGQEREDEGDLTMSAQFATPEALNFMITHGRGLLCMPCDAKRLDALRIGPMVRINDASCDTPFSVPIDHRSTSTGISVHDRATTIAAVLDQDSRPWDFRRPGHVFPLRARDRGVLERPGHTEASVDLCREAGSRSRRGDLRGVERGRRRRASARPAPLRRAARHRDRDDRRRCIEHRTSTGSRAALA